MKLQDTGLTFEDIKGKVNKYMIETYERFDFLADHAKGVYMYDENNTPYLDFYAGIAVNAVGNCNEKVVKAVQDQAATSITHTPFRRRCSPRRSARPSAWTRSSIRIPVPRPMKP